MNSVTQDHNKQSLPLNVPIAIIQRRAAKSFKPDPISPDLLKRLVELTIAAPSSFNLPERERLAFPQKYSSSPGIGK